jgi:hypothetical protein
MRGKCKDCAYWEPAADYHTAVTSRVCDAGDAGDCHRFPPYRADPGGVEYDPTCYEFPVTWDASWCGEFRQRD